MYLLYSALLAMAAVVSAPWWLLRMLRAGKYRHGIGERLGAVPARISTTGTPVVWVHAVSVGEVLAVSSLVRELRAKYPARRVMISTTTMAGQMLARERFGEESVFYFPLDFAFAVRPWLRALRPELVVLAETEFWPNFLRLAHSSGARVAVVNARISDRSLPRYLRFRGLLRQVLRNVDIFLAQTEQDRERLIAIGAAASQVQVSGNLKFDVKAPAASPLVQKLRAAIPSGAPVIICGSTMPEEEDFLLSEFRAVLSYWPQAVLVLAPRHPERFDAVALLADRCEYEFIRRSEWDGEEISGCVFLLDSVGELAAVYALAAVAIVCGSIRAYGGHNILEPAMHGRAILVGPQNQNFREIINIFSEAKAVRICQPADLMPACIELLKDETQREELGRRAAQVFREKSGATARTVSALDAMLGAGAAVSR